ncbi:hypothetical protein IAG44_20185 [Streptomyces roseirectus]|uniref:Uncharacterized protein n=1 Tax=Streptomyces roseirectus TaxID=2768066 RepID=A0A7H0IFF2_9ACTN|nr:hypothetical protein [Streptomyces roseirectus]QNP71518.1 hypothetical protein IAG44_20185 [Streptomyces roseirectus]
MRHSTARAISACLRALLSLLLPATGKRRKPQRPAAACPHLTSPTPPAPYVSPWSRPWTGPTKEEAAAFFRRQAEADAAREAHLQHERRKAAAYATLGVDYPYTYEGAPFGEDAFRATA